MCSIRGFGDGRTSRIFPVCSGTPGGGGRRRRPLGGGGRRARSNTSRGVLRFEEVAGEGGPHVAPFFQAFDRDVFLPYPGSVAL